MYCDSVLILIIQVTSEAEGGSLYKKPKRPCCFCGKGQTQLPRHMRKVHKDKEQVKEILKLPKQYRDEAFGNLRKQAMLKANIYIWKTLKDISNEKLHREGKAATSSTPNDAVICGYCMGVYSKKTASETHTDMSKGSNSRFPCH